MKTVRNLDGELFMKKGAIRWPWSAAGGGASKSSRLALGAYQPMTAGPYETSPDAGRSKLKALGALLATDRVRPGTMSPSEIDGFLAALAVGPGRIPAPEDWMPVIWGKGEPAFSDPDELWQAVDAIMSRVTEVYRQLREEPDAYRPVFRLADNDAEIAADWARGFLAGVTLRADAWEPLRRTPEVWKAVVFITMHITGWDKKVPGARSSKELAEVRREARTTIPSAVVDLYRFWRERDGRDGGNEAALKRGATLRAGLRRRQ
jgi:uncharacterized protein